MQNNFTMCICMGVNKSDSERT